MPSWVCFTIYACTIYIYMYIIGIHTCARVNFLSLPSSFIVCTITKCPQIKPHWTTRQIPTTVCYIYRGTHYLVTGIWVICCMINFPVDSCSFHRFPFRVYTKRIYVTIKCIKGHNIMNNIVMTNLLRLTRVTPRSDKLYSNQILENSWKSSEKESILFLLGPVHNS